MLIAARNAILAGGAALPYDAEVEYLASTGSQYIDIDYVMTDSTKYKISFSCNSSNTGSKMLFGIYSLKGDDPNVQFQKDNFAVNCGGSWNKTNVSLSIYSYPFTLPSPAPNNPQSHAIAVTQQIGQTNIVEYDSGRVLFNGNEILNEFSTMPNNPYNIPTYLFAAAVRQRNASVLPSYYFIGKIMNLKVQDEDYNTVRDFIPVRVGSGANAVGYMYDRVSGELFGNAGAGAFVIGPDASAANGGGISINA